MTDELSFGLADLEVEDDLDVALDNDTYQDQANPAPPVAGNYQLKAVKLGPKKNKEGAPVYENGDKRFPILSLQSAEIVEGLGDGITRKVMIFQDIKTKPFDRYGTPASNLMDVARAYGTANWAGVTAGIAAIFEAAQLGETFAAQLDWSVYDTEFVEAALEQFELAGVDKTELTDEQKKLKGAVYNAARVTGMGKFPYNQNSGKFVHVLQRGNVTVKTSTGDRVVELPHRALEARPTITRYFPKVDVESGRVKIGPLNIKAPKAVAA
jgi:hypothetical protein